MNKVKFNLMEGDKSFSFMNSKYTKLTCYLHVSVFLPLFLETPYRVDTIYRPKINIYIEENKN